VREGSVLKAGDLIARLDASDVQAAIAAADAALAQARAAQQQALAQLRQAQVERATPTPNCSARWAWCSRASCRRRRWTPRAGAPTRRRPRWHWRRPASRGPGRQAQARPQVQAQQVNRANTEVRAPFDGVVLVKNANVGDMITPFSSAAGTSGAVVTMADMGTLEVEADVAEANVGQVRIDQPVEITLDALPEHAFAAAWRASCPRSTAPRRR
jgi:HlyD family secretion protein